MQVILKEDPFKACALPFHNAAASMQVLFRLKLLRRNSRRARFVSRQAKRFQYQTDYHVGRFSICGELERISDAI